MAFSKQMTENLEHFKKVLQTDKNFDVVYRVIDIAGRKGCLFCVDGFTKDEVLLKVLQSWWSIQPDDMPEDADGFSSLMLILSLIKKTRKIFLKTAGLSVLCGITIFIVPMIGKLMYLVPWKDMLLLVIGILILVIISERLKEN